MKQRQQTKAEWVFRLLQWDSSNTLLPTKPHTSKTSPNSTTHWEPNAQMPDSMKAISHLSNYKVSGFLMSRCTSEWCLLLFTLPWRARCPVLMGNLPGFLQFIFSRSPEAPGWMHTLWLVHCTPGDALLHITFVSFLFVALVLAQCLARGKMKDLQR